MTKPKCPVCGSCSLVTDPDFESMSDCESCGSEFIQGTLEVIFNARTDI